MPDLPTLELTFRNVAGDPWEGRRWRGTRATPARPLPSVKG